jgi:hypothetical protein
VSCVSAVPSAADASPNTGAAIVVATVAKNFLRVLSILIPFYRSGEITQNAFF